MTVIMYPKIMMRSCRSRVEDEAWSTSRYGENYRFTIPGILEVGHMVTSLY